MLHTQLNGALAEGPNKLVCSSPFFTHAPHTFFSLCLFLSLHQTHTHTHRYTVHAERKLLLSSVPPFAHNALTTHGRFTSAMGSYTRKADQAEGRTAPMYFSRTTAPEQCTSSRFCFLFEPTGGGARRVTRWILLYKAKRYKKQKKNTKIPQDTRSTPVCTTQGRAQLTSSTTCWEKCCFSFPA